MERHGRNWARTSTAAAPSAASYTLTTVLKWHPSLLKASRRLDGQLTWLNQGSDHFMELAPAAAFGTVDSCLRRIARDSH